MASKCVSCNEQVWAHDAGNKLATQDGNTECPGPYWIVRKISTGAAVFTFITVKDDKSPMQRARETAKKKGKDFKAIRISPHGHQVRT